MTKNLSGPEEETLQALIDQYEPLLYTIAVGILGKHRREDAEEVVADSFLAWWQHRDTPIANLKAYLAMTAKNMALNRLKNLNRRQYDAITEDIPDVFTPSPDDAVMEKVNSEIIRAVLDGLTPPDGEIFIRRYFWCQPVKEIARQLGLKPKTVENRLYLAKKTLRERLLAACINL